MIGAVEAGGTKFVCALTQPDGTMVARTLIPTRTPQATFAEVRTFFEQASASHGPIKAFGIGSFGPIDTDPASRHYGAFTTTPKPGWSGARWQDPLAGFGAVLAIDTDVNAAAVGEWALGAGRGCATLAYTTVGTGIGSGIVRDGLPIRGFAHYEMGHIPTPHDLATDPFPGTCPFHRDCLEGLASGPAILARWGKDLTQLGDEPGALELIAGYLAHLAATLILTHMPERLIFGGGVAKAPGLLAAVRAATRRRLGGYLAAQSLSTDLGRTIVPPGLGDDAGLVGAITLAQRALQAAAGA